MKINKDNYQAYILDYHEGNLSIKEVADLLLFIEQHPETKEEFDSFENVSMEDYATYTFENKGELKKEITINNYEDYFIRAVENTLTLTEKEMVALFIVQYPQFAVEYELFQKTKLHADAALVFEHKDKFKRIAVTDDDVLIASIEGILSDKEQIELNNRLAIDKTLQHSLALYKQTKLVPDRSIVFDGKENLKRREKKIVPLYYYVAVAASFLLIFGLGYFFFVNNTSTNEMARNTVKYPVPGGKNQALENKNQEQAIEKQLAQVGEKSSNFKVVSIKKPIHVVAKPEITIYGHLEKVEEKQPIINNEPLANNNKEIISNKEEPVIEKEQPITKNQALASNQPLKESLGQSSVYIQSSDDYLTISEMAVQKLKENAMDEETVKEQKKSGRLNRLSGWDMAQLLAKGVSKLTGRDIEIKPTYNDKGDVTAYALAAGDFKMSRGK